MSFSEEQLQSVFRQLTKKELLTALSGCPFTVQETRTRQTVYDAIHDYPASQSLLQDALIRKRRRVEEESTEIVKRMRLDQEHIEPLDDEFFVDVGEDVRQRCVIDFIDATGNDALSFCACILCGGEHLVRETIEFSLCNLPNKHLLRPGVQRDRLPLVDGMLLYPNGVVERDGQQFGHVCASCQYYFQSKKPSPYFLVNNLWPGDVPPELSMLTLPERVLVARYYPAAYIVKLYPRRRGGLHWDEETLNSGLRGNVSSYRLNTQDIVSMLEGHYLPPPPILLASVIGVTIVGPNNVPERHLPHLLTVSRSHVRNALRFLVAENPLYADVVISEENLNLLPEYGVPAQLSSVVHVSDDISALHEEHDGYVDEDSNVSDSHSLDDNPSTVPIQAYGVLDPSISEVDDHAILAHAFANTSRTDKEVYAVRRGGTFVSEYPRYDDEGTLSIGKPENPNHLLGAFPWLFPYGTGGFEVDRPVPLSYEAHAKWALKYADRRFRTDLQFVFQVFGVIQKRQVCRSAAIQVRKNDFIRNYEAFRRLKPADLWTASQEQDQHHKFSNPAVRSLQHHVSVVRSLVMGTDESRTKIRSLVWGMVIKKNPPSLWITINPSDTQNPIAQVFTGAEIDLDRFERTSGPDSHDRSIRIARDPYAAAKYFHFTIHTVLHVLFGISSSEGTVKRKEGIFGRVEAYIGTVEAQGRGTLHLHMLVWLRGAPTASRMKVLLESEDFRERMAKFVSINICGSVENDASNESQAVNLPRNSSISYARPVDPRLLNYQYERNMLRQRLADTLQIHKCGPACTTVLKGKLICKRHAPFPVAAKPWVDSQGRWGPARVNGMMNNWVPLFLDTVLCNNDGKLITNGEETRHFNQYFTNYATKHQPHSFNSSALLARTLTFHQSNDEATSDVRNLNKKLIQRCANSLSRDQEFSAPEVISYLMGWGDRYISHHFEPIYISTVLSLLKDTYPALAGRSVAERGGENDGTNTVEESASQQQDDNPEYSIVEIRDGSLKLRDRVKDYVERGSALADFSFLDFFTNTYDSPKSSTDQEAELPLRKRNVRICYEPDRPKRCRVLRTEEHEVMPYFPGRWFPRSDREESRALYCAAILALLKPWRHITDIKPVNATFENTFELFISQAPSSLRNVIENIQYYYSCADKAKEHRETNDLTTVNESSKVRCDDEEQLDENEVCDEDVMEIHLEGGITENDIEEASRSTFSVRERMYADIAIGIAEDNGIFSSNDEWKVMNRAGLLARSSDENDLCQCRKWTSAVEEQRGVEIDDEQDLGDVNMEMTQQLDTDPRPLVVKLSTSNSGLEESPYFKTLKYDQRMAYKIVENHLLSENDNQQPPQLLMYVGGHGGVGKTFLIDAIDDLYTRHGLHSTLAKTATTGVAASSIGGSTLHSWAGLPARTPRSDTWAIHPNSEMATRRRNNIVGKRLLITDEISMLTTDTLADLSQVLAVVLDKPCATEPLAGMSVMATGDFHQLPPIGKKSRRSIISTSLRSRTTAKLKRALFQAKQPTTRCEMGRNTFLQFDTVIFLREQVRIDDPEWAQLLDRARVGECTKEDLRTIRSLILGQPDCETPNFTTDPWKDAVLVTPRNSVRVRWNELAVKKHCKLTGSMEYQSVSENSTTNGPLTMLQKLTVAQMPIEDTGDLEFTLNFAVGSPVMVTENICPAANLANGTRGVITDIILDPRERNQVPSSSDSSECNLTRLNFPPIYVVIRLPPTATTHVEFNGLPPRHIPIFPVTHHFFIGSKPRIRVTRRQLPLTLAHAFTDFKSQGQTLPYVLVDIGKTTNFGLTPFNAYVALSRGQRRSGIRLLRDFEDSLFTRHPSEALREEDARLEKLATSTRRRFETGGYGAT